MRTFTIEIGPPDFVRDDPNVTLGGFRLSSRTATRLPLFLENVEEEDDPLRRCLVCKPLNGGDELTLPEALSLCRMPYEAEAILSKAGIHWQDHIRGAAVAAGFLAGSFVWVVLIALEWVRH